MSWRCLVEQRVVSVLDHDHVHPSASLVVVPRHEVGRRPREDGKAKNQVK